MPQSEGVLSGGQDSTDELQQSRSPYYNGTDPNNGNGEDPGRPRRRRWRFRLRRGGDEPSKGKVQTKSLSISCKCKSGAAKGSCLILLASFVELLGSLSALIVGITFIQSACNFYDLDSDPDQRAKEYDEKLERVLFLEKYRVGFIGLLATCSIGILISFLMPIGTLYKSWKCLRAAMALLFAVSLVHILLLCIYLIRHELMGTIAVVPFRLYEIFLIANYIKHYKKKKIEELKERAKQVCTAAGTIAYNQNCLENASICSFDSFVRLPNSGLLGLPQAGNAMQTNIDLANGKKDSNDQLAIDRDLVLEQMKITEFLNSWKKEPHKARLQTFPDRYTESDFK